MGYDTLIAFAVFIVLGLIVYTVVPLRFKKRALCFLSLACFAYLARFGTAVLIVEAVITYIAALIIDGIGKRYVMPEDRAQKKKLKQKIKRKKQAVFVVYALITLLILIGFKNINLILTYLPEGFKYKELLTEFFKNKSFFATVGMSYYMLQAMGYVWDTLRSTQKSEKNFITVLLFCSFFPQLNEGPFSKASELMPQINNCKKLSLSNIQSGVFAVLGGLFKILVVADRAGMVVSEVFSNYEKYKGLHVVMAVLFFTIQLYAEFSGYIDIASGTATMFGISLPKNFDLPFTASSVGEFWRRWHITLGRWFRDYVFYGVSTSRFVKWITKHFKGALGKTLVMLVTLTSVWFLTGIWHGFALKYAVYGMYYCIIILFETLFEPVLRKPRERAPKLFELLGIIKTFILVNIGMFMFRAENLTVFAAMLKSLPHNSSTSVPGMEKADLFVLVIAVGVLIICGLLKYMGIDVHEKYKALPGIAKYWVCFAMVMIIAVFGAYGMGYIPPDPIYGGF